jgi:mevalonate kinase
MTQEQKNKKRLERDVRNTSSITAGFTGGMGVATGLQHIQDKKALEKNKKILSSLEKKLAGLGYINPANFAKVEVPPMGEYIKSGAKRGLKYGLGTSAAVAAINRFKDKKRDEFWDNKMKAKEKAGLR